MALPNHLRVAPPPHLQVKLPDLLQVELLYHLLVAHPNAILKSFQANQERRKSKDMVAVFAKHVAGSLRQIEPRKRELLKVRTMAMIVDVQFGEDPKD